jgi:hypothetical protein
MEAFSALWITVILVLIADLLDITISYIDSALIPGWGESNEMCRHLGTHTFWMGPAVALHLEFYLIWLVVGLIFYRFLRIMFAPKLASWILCLFLWYQIYDVMSEGVLGNIAIAVFYFGWLRKLALL